MFFFSLFAKKKGTKMNTKEVLMFLCGIWALGIGARMSYCLLAHGGACVYNYPRFVVAFDYIPLAVFGMFLLAFVVRDIYLGDVIKNAN